MKILAIDTSSPVATAAIMCDGCLVGEYLISNGKTHSQIILPIVAEMLEKVGLEISDIDVFATSLGPGSFTGLRIGVATVKTFAQTTNKEIIGISSLDGLASNIMVTDTVVCPIVDARRGNVYNAIYKNGEKLVDDRLISLESVLDELKGQKAVFLGDGILKHRDKIVEIMGDDAIFPPAHLANQRASSIAYLADLRANNNDFDNLYSLEPIYIRPSQAERELNGDKD